MITGLDKITKLYWQLNPKKKFNFYEISGFRVGYNGKSASGLNYASLPAEVQAIYESGIQQGKDAKLGLK